MRGLLTRLTRSPRPETPPVEHPVCVIGDVHGRRDLLGRLLSRVDAEAPDAHIVMVGDLVDRGPDSRGVIDLLAARPAITVLRGNHEDMLLRFLDAPAQEGPRWLYNGGVQTCESFGLPGLTEHSPPGDLETAALSLGRALGPRRAWLDARPLSWSTPGLFVSHAGADPARAPGDQPPRDLLWGHAAFRRQPRRDGLWVAHGHWVVDHPSARAGRIATDTGAWFTDTLTAALVTPGAPVRFLQT